MHGQSRKASIIESLLNVAIGYGISVLANYYVLPLFGISVSMLESAAIGVVFTAISIARSYMLRRLFNLAYLRGWMQ